MEKNERLKYARTKSGFRTAREAAEYLSIPYGTYSGHENGSRGVKEAELLHYAKVFKVSPFWLIYGQQKPIQKVRLVGLAGKAGDMNVPTHFDSSVIEIEAPFPLEPQVRALKVVSDEFQPTYWINDIIFIDENNDARHLQGRRVAAKLAKGIVLGTLLSLDSSGLCHIQTPSGKVHLGVPVTWIAPVIGVLNHIG